MAASRCFRSSAWLAAFWLGLAAVAHAEPSLRAELTCLLDSGNLLPGAPASAVAEEPPWQQLASLRRGDDNRARLTLATADVGFLPDVTTSALLRLELGLSQDQNGRAASITDASSSLELAWQPAPATRLTLRAFPLDTDYLRLGYLHALDWGGTDTAHGESVFVVQSGPVPGLQIGLSTPRIRLFSALKWANVDDPLRGQRRLWGSLSGGSVEVGPAFRVDGGFGYFQRMAFELAKPAAASFVEGASLRVVWHGAATEPELSAEPFRPASLRDAAASFEADPAPGFALALEGVTLVERLRRFEAPRFTALAPAPAVALYGSVRGRDLAVHAALSWRSLAFVLRNDARLARGETLPVSAVQKPELTAWMGASLTLRPVYLVPSVELAVRLPAALQTPSALPGYQQTLVAGGAAGFQALPVGAGRLPVVSGRLGLRFQASASLMLALFGEYERNPNRVTFAASSAGVTRGFAAPDSLAVFSAVQARL